jgi:hypothetical protein
MNRLSTFRRVGLSFAFALFSASIYGEPPDKNIVSRTAEIDGVKLHYITAYDGRSRADGHFAARLCGNDDPVSIPANEAITGRVVLLM